ncbi:MAG TPA: response regulator [Opitutus sp.]|nr:response regulator [Opitutus sp.]
MPHLRPILLAEDNPNDLELVLTAFQDSQLANEVIVARDGEEALDYLHGRGAYAGKGVPAPAVILLDWKMPRVDGREVLRQVRAHPLLRATPVVILTSSKEEVDLLQGYQLGANAYVVKPVGFEDFITTVGRLGFFWALLNEPPPVSPPPLASAALHQP